MAFSSSDKLYFSTYAKANSLDAAAPFAAVASNLA